MGCARVLRVMRPTSGARWKKRGCAAGAETAAPLFPQPRHWRAGLGACPQTAIAARRREATNPVTVGIEGFPLPGADEGKPLNPQNGTEAEGRFRFCAVFFSSYLLSFFCITISRTSSISSMASRRSVPFSESTAYLLIAGVERAARVSSSAFCVSSTAPMAIH